MGPCVRRDDVMTDRHPRPSNPTAITTPTLRGLLPTRRRGVGACRCGRRSVRQRPPLPDRYAALQKCSEESANISAIRCHIRERPPVYRMGLPHRLD
jgi:hypothetical protein